MHPSTQRAEFLPLGCKDLRRPRGSSRLRTSRFRPRGDAATPPARVVAERAGVTRRSLPRIGEAYAGLSEVPSVSGGEDGFAGQADAGDLGVANLD